VRFCFPFFLQLDDAIEIALAHLGLDQPLRPRQRETIVHLLAGKDVFAQLPTGYGKSLCFQLLPFVWDALNINQNCGILIVMPLISIIIDQISKLRGLKIPFIWLKDVNEELLEDLENESFRFIYTTPEAILSNPCLGTLYDAESLLGCD